MQARSRLTLAGVLETVEGSEEDGSERDLRLFGDYDADKDGRIKLNQRDNRIHGTADMYENREQMKDQEQPRDRRAQRETDFEDLRGQVRFLKEANKKVLIQNQKLMNEVEKTSFELQASRAKVSSLLQ